MEPFWNITSSIDWCEENWMYSNYIAEFWNTLSSFSMVISGLYLLYTQNNSTNLMKLKHYKLLNLNLTSIFMIIIGFGSVLFHMTLSRYSQALDEVPMIWTSLLLIHLSLNELINMDYKTHLIEQVLLLVYGMFATLCITTTENELQFTLFHINNTIISTLVIILFYILSRVKNISRDKDLFKKSIIFFGFALSCWSFDLFLCHYTTYFQIQLHAMWHVFSSIGFFYLIKILEESYVYNYKNSLKKMI